MLRMSSAVLATLLAAGMLNSQAADTGAIVGGALGGAAGAAIGSEMNGKNGAIIGAAIGGAAGAAIGSKPKTVVREVHVVERDRHGHPPGKHKGWHKKHRKHKHHD